MNDTKHAPEEMAAEIDRLKAENAEMVGVIRATLNDLHSERLSGEATEEAVNQLRAILTKYGKVIR